jgi:hypothetical protein
MVLERLFPAMIFLIFSVGGPMAEAQDSRSVLDLLQRRRTAGGLTLFTLG